MGGKVSAPTLSLPQGPAEPSVYTGMEESFIQHSPNTQEKGSGGQWSVPSSPLVHSLARRHLLPHTPVQVTKGKKTSQPRDTYVNDDTFVKQALLLGSHDKIMSAVFVVNNVLKINP